ncbi:MAG: hypothetical protein KAH38_02115, partial [Candidatus Hydrogenedentes bacterium]|nr:hypothetical protein [Candidatus Hydrogenedentota bacterium]
MKKHIWQIIMVAVMLTTVMTGAVANGEFLMHGRVSFDTGTAMIKNGSEENWSAAVVNTLVLPGDTLWVDQSGTAEVEMAGASFLRLADGSKAEVVSLPPNAYVRGWAGSFYIHRMARSQGEFIFTTPSATLEIPADALVRVDIDAAGAATISVGRGTVNVRTDQGGEVTAAESTRVWIDPGLLPSEPVPFNRAQGDAFDDWNNDRTRLLTGGMRTTPKSVVIQNSTVGGYDLDRYGEWVSVDNRPYWRPTVVTNYVPYRHGRWNYMSRVGHVWVDEYPFAYVTTHYGRWRHTPSYGWLWSYDAAWSPAWVASVRVGDYYAWSPVDYYHRPVMVTGASTFTLGGVSFCSYSTSYVQQPYLYSGPTHVYAPTSVVVNMFNAAPPRQVNIWNITPNRRSRPSVPYDSRFIANERDYNPRRSIRGGQGDWVKEYAPGDRVRRLEASLGRTKFATAATHSSSRRSVRTAATAGARVANTRQVRLARTEQTYLARSARPSKNTAANRAMFVPESSRLGSLANRSGETLRSSGSTRESVRSRSGGSSLGTTRGTTRTTSSSRSKRTGAQPLAGGSAGSHRVNNSSRIALRDMESGAPAPRPRPGRSPVRQNGRSSSSTQRRSAPVPTASPTLRRTAPAPAPKSPRTLQRSAPAPTSSRNLRRSTPTSSSSRTQHRSAP